MNKRDFPLEVTDESSGPPVLRIIKSSGKKEIFDQQKLVKSLERAGAAPAMAKQIAMEVESELYPAISSHKIQQKAFARLRNTSRKMASSYRLREALLELGPTGYLFENFVAELLQAMGYRVKTGQIIEGHCVSHEVDVIAEREEHHFMIECKFHNRRGLACDVKVPLYIQARFKDVETAWLELPGHGSKFHQAWIFTNTKFTTDAIKYGECMRLNLIGWNYPRNKNLQIMVEKLGLFPVTAIPSLRKAERKALLDLGLLLCTDLMKRPEVLLSVGIDDFRSKKIMAEAEMLSVRSGENLDL